MNKTCLQCGSILRPGVRACSFCDSRLSDDVPAEPAAHQSRGNSQADQLADSVWRGELANRVASYRARRRKSSSDSGQPDLPFEQEVVAPLPAPATSVAIAEPQPTANSDDFSFSIAIGRTANRKTSDEAQMYIDVSLPPADDRRIGSTAVAPEGSYETEQTGLYPVASIEERRLAGLIDTGCLLFACGGFLALFGSLGGHFAFSKLSAVVYATSFAIVYLQYFALFTVFGGTTPGMMMRGLHVVDFSGEDPAPRQLLLRAAGYLLSAGTFFLGFLWAQWDEDELTWHDRISHTYLSSASSIADTELHGAAHTH